MIGAELYVCMIHDSASRYRMYMLDRGMGVNTCTSLY